MKNELCYAFDFFVSPSVVRHRNCPSLPPLFFGDRNYLQKPPPQKSTIFPSQKHVHWDIAAVCNYQWFH